MSRGFRGLNGFRTLNPRNPRNPRLDLVCGRDPALIWPDISAAITGLTPGTVYNIQVRAVTKAGYTDWSDPVTRICT